MFEEKKRREIEFSFVAQHQRNLGATDRMLRPINLSPTMLPTIIISGSATCSKTVEKNFHANRKSVQPGDLKLASVKRVMI